MRGPSFRLPTLAFVAIHRDRRVQLGDGDHCPERRGTVVRGTGGEQFRGGER